MIDWSKAPEGYNWHAFDRNGIAYWYSLEPYFDEIGWMPRDGGVRKQSCYSVEFTYISWDSWDSSLEQRPHTEPQLKPTSVTVSLVPPTDETRLGGSFDIPLREGFKELCDDLVEKHLHYHKNVAHLDSIDVYQVFRLWGTTDHEIEHAIKKLLNAGQRGAKSKRQDVQEAIDTLKRYLEITGDDQ